jgi:hypothetical protein
MSHRMALPITDVPVTNPQTEKTGRKHGSGSVVVERRAAVRYPVERESACQAMKGHKDLVWPAVIKDISTRGIRLEIGRRFEPGTLLMVELQSGHGGTLRRLMLKTVYLQSIDDKTWLIGGTFISRLADADLRSLLRQLVDDPALTDTRPCAEMRGDTRCQE